MSRRHLLAPIEMECRPALSGHTLWMGSLAAKAADCKSVTRKHRRFVLRFTSVGAEQTSTGRFAPSNTYKLFEKSLTKNFLFCIQYRVKDLTDGALLSFIYNYCSTPSHNCKTKFCTKVLCLLSFKKVSWFGVFWLGLL